MALGLVLIQAGFDFQPPPPTPTIAVPTPIVVVPWEINCEDEIRENGYLFQGYCVPGHETYEASRFENPGLFGGGLSSYADGVMERVCDFRGFGCNNGAVAVMGCGDLGKKAFIDRLDGTGWQGPFTIADCSGRHGVWYNVMIGHLAVEIDYQTAQAWGVKAIGYVNVMIPANGGGILVDRIPPLWEWYAANAMSFEWFPGMIPAAATSSPTQIPTPTDLPWPTVAPLPSAAIESTVIPKEDNAMDPKLILLALLPFVPALLTQVISIGVGLFGGAKPSKGTLQWIVYGASVGATLYLNPVPLPVFGEDPILAVGTVLAFAGVVSSGAQVYYDKWVQPVLGGIDKRVFWARPMGLLAPKRTLTS